MGAVKLVSSPEPVSIMHAKRVWLCALQKDPLDIINMIVFLMAQTGESLINEEGNTGSYIFQLYGRSSRSANGDEYIYDPLSARPK